MILLILHANTEPGWWQVIAGNRGVFFPCLLVTDDDRTAAVSSVLIQSRAAVFEIKKAGPSLAWEIGEATSILGTRNVVCVDSAALRVVVVVEGVEIEGPCQANEWELPAEHAELQEAALKVLARCTRALRVDPDQMRRPRRWYRLWSSEPRLLGMSRMHRRFLLAAGTIATLTWATASVYATWRGGC